MATQRQATLLIGTLILLLNISARCQDNESFEDESRATRHLPASSRQITSKRTLVEPLYMFATKVFRTINEPTENVIFSPVAVNVALNMLSLGVAKGSQTERDMLQCLGHDATNSSAIAGIHETNLELRSVVQKIKEISGKSRRNTKLDLINYALVSMSGLSRDYMNQTGRYYGTAVQEIHNKADRKRVLDEINKWGKDTGFSTDILPEGALGTSPLILFNGIRIEAFWFEPFFEADLPYSTNSPLYREKLSDKKDLASKKVKKALLLHKTRIKYLVFTKSDDSRHGKGKHADIYDELARFEFRAIRIDLFGDVSYTIIEPLGKDAGTEGLAKLEAALLEQTGTSARLSKLLTMLDDVDDVVADLVMPGFKYEQEIDLKKPLSSIGLNKIFDSDSANLTVMYPDGGLYVGQVKHQAMIEVKEYGIKAAAVVRVMVFMASLIQPDAIDVNIDNPFMYVLRLNKLPLFIGHLVRG